MGGLRMLAPRSSRCRRRHAARDLERKSRLQDLRRPGAVPARMRHRGSIHQDAVRNVHRQCRSDQRNVRSAVRPASSRFHGPIPSSRGVGFFDILQTYRGCTTCYNRTLNIGLAALATSEAHTQGREWPDAAIERIRSGGSTGEVAASWRCADEFGFTDTLSALGLLQFGRDPSLALRERPIIGRGPGRGYPTEVKTGMMFSPEAYRPVADGVSAARNEEVVIVTDAGHEGISRFTARVLPIANEYWGSIWQPSTRNSPTRAKP